MPSHRPSHAARRARRAVGRAVLRGRAAVPWPVRCDASGVGSATPPACVHRLFRCWFRARVFVRPCNFPASKRNTYEQLDASNVYRVHMRIHRRILHRASPRFQEPHLWSVPAPPPSRTRKPPSRMSYRRIIAPLQLPPRKVLAYLSSVVVKREQVMGSPGV